MKIYKEIEVDLAPERLRIERAFKDDLELQEKLYKVVDIFETGDFEKTKEYLIKHFSGYDDKEECPTIEFVSDVIFRVISDYCCGTKYKAEKDLK